LQPLAMNTPFQCAGYHFQLLNRYHRLHAACKSGF
jgi:hypothetical protein